MNAEQARAAVGTAKVIAFTASRTHSVTAGVVLAYSEQPQVLILTEQGERIWWRADLCEEVPR